MMKDAKGKTDFKAGFIERLKNRGYTVTEDAKSMGKSGVEHTFDILAHKDDGFVSYRIAVGVAIRDNDEVGLGALFNFDEKAYDAGISDKAFIAIPKLGSMPTNFAQKQRIKVFDEERIVRFLASASPPVRTGKYSPVKLGSKAQFLKSLAGLGYRVEENVQVKGKSGVEYTFDMLAYNDDDFDVHRVSVDFVAADDEVDLNQVTLLDTKTYDVGICHKVLVVSPKLSSDAWQFVTQQRIKVFEVDKFTFEELTSEYSSDDKKTVPLLRESAEIDLAEPLPDEPVAKDDELLTGIPELEEPVLPPGGYDATEETYHGIAQSAGDRLSVSAPVAEAEEKPSGVSCMNSLLYSPTPEALQLVPEDLARRYKLVPMSLNGEVLQVAMAHTENVLAIEALAARTKKRIEPISATENDIHQAIDFNYRNFSDIAQQLDAVSASNQVTATKVDFEADLDTPVVQAINTVIEEAVKARASDIHIVPETDRLRIRYRIDGTLHDVLSLPSSIHTSLVSRIKILASMNIADPRRPQDGQISINIKGKDVDIRVASIYSVNGEMMVLRLLDKSLAALDLSELGFLPECQEKYDQMLMKPYGMVLVSGPTGAGKTTTLYASVNSLEKITRHIITIEDPVEYHFKDINQVQVNPKAGLTFASGLRSIVRLDPDVILVGEIRDGETAQIAVQSALTGHLVLSSVHANDTVGVIFRLVDLGIEPFLICSGVIGIVAQRMVRRICSHCARKVTVPMAEQMAYSREMGEERNKFVYGEGCQACANTGYTGRVGIFEILPITDKVRQLIMTRATAAQIRAQALEDGMIPIARDGMLKVKAGITTPYEVMHNAYTTD